MKHKYTTLTCSMNPFSLKTRLLLKEHPFLKLPPETFRQFLKLIKRLVDTQGWQGGYLDSETIRHLNTKYRIWHKKRVSSVLKTGVATKQHSFYYVSYYANFFIQKQSLSVVYNASSWKAPVLSKRKYLSEADQS